MSRNCLFLLIMLSLFNSIIPCIGEICEYTLQAENGFYNSPFDVDTCLMEGSESIPVCIQQRSRASGGFTAHLNKTGQMVSFNITAHSSCFFAISKFSYSNDGLRDTFSVRLNEEDIGIVHTLGRTNSGHLWNVFHSYSEFEKRGFLHPANQSNPFQAVLAINLTETDEYGVELDSIETKITCDGACPVILPHHPQNIEDGSTERILNSVRDYGIPGIVLGAVNLLFNILSKLISFLCCNKTD